MTINYVPLDKDKHSNIKVKARHEFEYAKTIHMAAVTLREMPIIGGNMPIVFVKDPNTGNFHTIAMFGLEKGSNLYVKDNKWQTHVLPMSVQRFPFDVRPDGDKLGVFIDENSDLITDDGEPLFNDKGEATEFLQMRHRMLSDIANSEMATGRMIKMLDELGLFEEVQLNVLHADGNKRSVTGMFVISEERLNKLDDDKIIELRKAGFLGAVYAHLLSLGQINRLAYLASTTDAPIMSIQIAPAASAEQAQKAAETADA
ncbi:SapC family protein [Aestuariibacter halophilus]|uniref:SapC family protein n=1 Tax=Fluctibacter halophilus TaxID=226011 RepID=A0ABS8GB39_9ALTE|nr:SapC family protein [Aestuariibacter halophilus]MCC2616441.1 SapC family protein [Aestuariibacter halophilus]